MKLRFQVSGDLLADSLHLPPRTFIADIERDGQNFILTVAVSPQDDDRTFEVHPTVFKQEVRWEWNLPESAAESTPNPEPHA